MSEAIEISDLHQGNWLHQFAAQHGEDKWLCDHWAELRLPEFGFFVEFGAGDGVYLSNTYWLEHSKGWHGLLCEPDPRNVIRDRPHSMIEHIAIGPRGVAKLGCPDDPYLSGTRRTTDASQKAVRAQHVIEVPMLPLSEVLDKYGVDGIDVISIDTEGTELEAWRTLNLKRWRPRLVIIELMTWGLPDNSREIVAALAADNYQMIHRTHHNGIFVDTR